MRSRDLNLPPFGGTSAGMFAPLVPRSHRFAPSLRLAAIALLSAASLLATASGPAWSQAPQGNGAQPVPAQGTGDPHTILPQPPPGKAAIGMSVRFGEKEPLIPRGLEWRVFADVPESSGAYPLVAESTDPAPVFFLSTGGYVVHVSYGLASVARRIAVGEDSRR